MAQVEEEFGRVSLCHGTMTIAKLMERLAETKDRTAAMDITEQIVHTMALRDLVYPQFGKDRARKLRESVAVIEGILSQKEMNTE
jgi:hypothetical protein